MLRINLFAHFYSTILQTHCNICSIDPYYTGVDCTVELFAESWCMAM